MPTTRRLEYLTARFVAVEYQIVNVRPPVMSVLPAEYPKPCALNGCQRCSTTTLVASKRPAGTSMVSVPTTRARAVQVYGEEHALSSMATLPRAAPGESVANAPR